MIRDWTTWQLGGGDAFDQLKRVVQCLSSSPDAPLEIGELRPLNVNDARDYPTLVMPYGQQVPVVHASAGIRRIIALAYLLVWAWREHLTACELTNTSPAKRIIFLIDEIEAHLHPRWQRTVLAALLGVMDTLTGNDGVQSQLLAVTHSPLILASAETHFNPEQDGIWAFEQVGSNVTFEQCSWLRRVDTGNWLAFLGA